MRKKIRNSLSYRNLNESNSDRPLPFGSRGGTAIGTRPIRSSLFNPAPACRSGVDKRGCPKGDRARAQFFRERDGRVPIWIVIVVLIIILGVGFGVWKIFFAPKPLKIKDLEDAHITITRSSIANGWRYYFFGGVEIDALGEIDDNENVFHDEESSAKFMAVLLEIQKRNENIVIQLGDTVVITYDGGQTLTIYLPAMTADFNYLYVAADGSTYYDRALTQLAWSPDSAEPLQIRDMESMEILELAAPEGGGWTISATGIGDTLLGAVYDDPKKPNSYDDESAGKGPAPLEIAIDIYPPAHPKELVDIPAGYCAELTFDGGQKQKVYFPHITGDDLIKGGTGWYLPLYAASDGSTYYDKTLTQLAQPTPKP